MLPNTGTQLHSGRKMLKVFPKQKLFHLNSDGLNQQQILHAFLGSPSLSLPVLFDKSGLWITPKLASLEDLSRRRDLGVFNSHKILNSNHPKVSVPEWFNLTFGTIFKSQRICDFATRCIFSSAYRGSVMAQLKAPCPSSAEMSVLIKCCCSRRSGHRI